KVVGVGGARVGVGGDPGLGAAVAGFAADPVGQLEAVAALVGGDVVGVAVEAFVGPRRIADAELAGDRPALLGLQRLPGTGGVRVVLLPAAELVQPDVAGARDLGGTVAGAAAAGRHAQVGVLGDAADGGGRVRGRRQQQR